MIDHFIVHRPLSKKKTAIEIQDMLDEVLAMADVDDMKLITSVEFTDAANYQHLFLIFSKKVQIINSMLRPQKRKKKNEINYLAMLEEAEEISSGHTLHRCNSGECFVCEGGLAQCSVCDGAEGELTTKCPGIKLSNPILNRIYRGDLDYNKSWWYERISWAEVKEKYDEKKPPSKTKKGGNKSRKT
jgi:hypothetical protein